MDSMTICITLQPTMEIIMIDKIEPTYTFGNDFGDITEKSPAASKMQVGGDHYTKLGIQPMEYSMANDLNALQHTAIKYITRYKDKGNPLLDLAKAVHCIEMLIEHEVDK